MSCGSKEWIGIKKKKTGQQGNSAFSYWRRSKLYSPGERENKKTREKTRATANKGARKQWTGTVRREVTRVQI